MAEPWDPSKGHTFWALCVEVQLKGVGGFISPAKYCLSERLHEQKDSEFPSLSLANQSPHFPSPGGGIFLP